MSSSVMPFEIDALPDDLPAVLDQLADTHPAMGLAMVRAIADAGAPALRDSAKRLMEALADDSRLDSEIDAIVSRAAAAQSAFESWSEERVDNLLRDLARTFEANAEALAIAAVHETGRGNVMDKTIKNRFASRNVFEALEGKPANGPVSFDVDRHVTEIASPVGVVFGIVPVTNPAATAIFKTLIALKGRNALILSFHHQALGLAAKVAELARDVLVAHGAPSVLVQVVPKFRASRKATRRLMGHPQVSLVLATGGAGLVKAAYSSGTPAIGVGPGNAPVWIAADADLDRAARSIVVSKTFDNGLVCGAEHNLVVDERVATAFREALGRYGAVVLTRDQERLFQLGALDDYGSLRPELVGRRASFIACAVGLDGLDGCRLMVIPADVRQIDTFYGGEKLAPILSLFTVKDDDEAVRVCQALLRSVGAGHTAVVHSTSPARVDRFARAMRAGRILVNVPAAQGCCGMATGLDGSMTLGCGTFGGNSTTDNVTFRHLLNIKRVAYSLE